MTHSDAGTADWPFTLIRRADIDELSPTQLGELQSVMRSAIEGSWRDRALRAEERLYAGKTVPEAQALRRRFCAELAANMAPDALEGGAPDSDESRPEGKFLLGLELKDWIKAARRNAGWTQQCLAEELGRTKANISAWEAGRHRPSVDQLRMISEFTGFPFLQVGRAGDAQQQHSGPAGDVGA